MGQREMCIECRVYMTGVESLEIWGAIKDQWKSMTGMAAMFTFSILYAVFILPVYNYDVYRGFGESGTTKTEFIFLELGIILLFTVLIIWLARKGLQVLIKWFIFFALGYSLLIALSPILFIIFDLLRIESNDSGILLFNVVSLVSTFLLMGILYNFPEWYVVNTVGVLVGSGVIVMIGIAFVPVLIIIFMILAAIYDHWAVNKSKHMLELADTMIDLKLPVLLVSPKESGYSLIDNTDSKIKKQVEEFSHKNPVESVKNKPKRDALFMGLGDVIFPGILVISSITFLPEIGPVVFDFWGGDTTPIYLGPLLVGIGTLIGGLVGYAALMTQVARGKPQAGLPLLNGGSILGYLISGIFALGIDKLWQDITLF